MLLLTLLPEACPWPALLPGPIMGSTPGSGISGGSVCEEALGLATLAVHILQGPQGVGLHFLFEKCEQRVVDEQKVKTPHWISRLDWDPAANTIAKPQDLLCSEKQCKENFVACDLTRVKLTSCHHAQHPTSHFYHTPKE